MGNQWMLIVILVGLLLLLFLGPIAVAIFALGVWFGVAKT